MNILCLASIPLLAMYVSFAQAQYEPPLQQFKQGIPAQKIQCLDGYELILETSDGSPACVRPSSADILIKRGWGMLIQDNLENTYEPSVKSPIFAMFYESGSNHANLALFEKYLRPGDYLFITTPLDQDSDVGQVLQDATDARNNVAPGVNVLSFVWYSKIDAIKLHTPFLPKGIDGIIYDYEGGAQYSPEYTTNEQQVISLFNSGLKVAHENGLKFMITPVFGDIVNNTEIEHPWNWIELSNNSDFMIIQFQSFFKMSNANALSTRMGEIMSKINATSQTPTFVELSLTAIGGSADEDLKAINDLKQVGVDKFLIFFEPWTTNDLQYILENRP